MDLLGCPFVAGDRRRLKCVIKESKETRKLEKKPKQHLQQATQSSPRVPS